MKLASGTGRGLQHFEYCAFQGSLIALTEVTLLLETPWSEMPSSSISSTSARTERAYRNAWAHFCAWCETRQKIYLPASATDVGAYLAERSETVGKNSLRISLAALAYYHRRYDHPWSSKQPEIARAMNSSHCEQRCAPQPAMALTSVEIRTMIDACGKDLAGVRDRALLLTGFAGALRRSELVAIDVEDLWFANDSLTLTIYQSKSDRDGAGLELKINQCTEQVMCPVKAMQTWLRKADIKYGPVFRAVDVHGNKSGRLTGDGLWWIVKSRAKRAGIRPPEGQRLSPQGLRAGMITEAYLRGVPDKQVIHLARQRSIETTRRYRQRD